MTLEEFFLLFSPWLDPFFLIYFGIINLGYVLCLILGIPHLFKRYSELAQENPRQIYRSNSLPEVSFVLAAYNEASCILHAVENLINLSYRKKQVIIINDGSKDETLELLKTRLQLHPATCTYKNFFPTQPIRGFYRSEIYPEFLIIDKENGKKFDALNAGLNACETSHFITIDADTLLDDATFIGLIRPIFTSPQTIAIGAGVRVRNDCKFNSKHIFTRQFTSHFISKIQALEYHRAFMIRQGWDALKGDFVLSGAFSVFSTAAVVQAGGYAPTIANDLEIVLRLQRVMRGSKTPFKIIYLPDPVAWTQVPMTWKHLASQRKHWHLGLLESLWFNKCLLFNPRYGFFGLIVYPFILFSEALEPIAELTGYLYILVGLYLGIASAWNIFLLLCLTWGMALLYTMFCIIVQELNVRKYPSLRNLVLLFLYSILENVGYRQMHLIWRLQGILAFFKKIATIQKESQKVNDAVKRFYDKNEKIKNREFKAKDCL